MSPRKPSSLRTRQRRELKLEIFELIRAEIRKMHSALDLGPLLWVICEGLDRLGLRFDYFGINLIDTQVSPPSGTFHFRTPAGGWGQYQYPNLAGLPLLAIWSQQRLAYRPDLQADDPYGERKGLDNPGLRSMVDIPFSHGTLALSSVLPEAFGADELELLQEMAALCSEGFGRLDELRVLERRAQEAEVLSAAIAVVAGASGLEEVFQVVVREAARLVAAERVTLFLYDETEHLLVPRAQLGHDWQTYRQIRLLPGEGVSGQVLLSGEGLLYGDPRSTHQSLRPENLDLMVRSAQLAGGTGAVAPLKLGGRTLGTLSVRSQTHHCTQRDLVLLERLAAQAALAIERARHTRELSLNLALQRVRNETLRMENEEDWTRVRLAFHEELAGLVDCCRCSIQLVDRISGQFVCYGSMHKLPASGPVELRAGLRQVVENGAPLYRRTRAEIESWGEVEISPEINSAVDVPFLGGTLAMNSRAENAFDPADIQVLQSFAQVMSEAHMRLRQLQRREAVRQVREAVWRMEKAEDLFQVLTVIRQQLIEVGVTFDDVGLNVVDTSTQPWAVQYYYYYYPDQDDHPDWVLWSSTVEPTNPQVFAFWRAGELCYRPHMQREDMLREGWEPDKLSHPVAAVVDVPFSAGTLALNSRYPDAFSPEDLAFFQELAGVLSEGFGRLEDLKNLEQRASEAEALAEGISAMAKSEHLDQVLQVVVEGAARLTGSVRARILLYNDKEQVLVPRAQVGHRWEIYRQLRVVPGEGLSGLVLSTGVPQLVNDPPFPRFRVPNQSLFEESLLDRPGPGTERSMGVPLIQGARAIGVLSVGGSRRRFTAHDLELLLRLGEQAALAIERTQRQWELSLNLALQRLRSDVLQMQEEADWLKVVEMANTELARLVSLYRYSIQLVRPGGFFVSYGAGRPEGREEMHPVLRETIEMGKPCYRRTRSEIEARGENLCPEVQSVVDVPFLGGTIAMSSTREDGFSDQDIQVLQSFALVMSEAYLRLRQLQRQEAVRQVREAVWRMEWSADLPQVLTVVKQQLVNNNLLFESLGVGVVEEAGRSPVVRHYSYNGNRREWVSWTWIPGGEPNPVIEFWEKGEVVYRRDLQAEDPFQEGRYFLPHVRCVVDVPFSHGTLALNSEVPNAFSADDIELFKELAVVLSEGFKRLDDLQQLEQRAQEAEALASAINAVYSYAELDQRLQEIVRQVRGLIGAERCMLLLYEEGEGVLVPYAREGYGEEVMQLRIRPGEGMTGHVFVTGKVYFNQTLPDPQFKPLSPQNQGLLEQSFRGGSMGSSAGIPLKLGGQVIGVVVAGQVGRVLGEREVLLLERLASQASLAIERSRQKRELSLNLALQRVRNQVLEMEEEEDWEQVLFSLHRELSGLVDFWFCSIQFVDLQAGGYTYYTTDFSQEGSHLQHQRQLPLTPSLKQVLETGQPLYRRNQREMERFGDAVGPEVECIIDVPFLGGTMAVNNTRENAFSDQDVAVLESFAQVISEGYRRLQDLRQLARARQRLQQSQKLEAVGQLTAGIAHNFNNLLQANLGNINLAMLSGSAEVQGYLQDADAAAMRGADLVRQLMLFTRAEVRETPFRTADLGAVIADTVSLCRKTIDRRIELQVEIPAALPLVQADTGQLEQVLLNLYLNARDAFDEVERPTPWIRTAARTAFQVGPGQDQGRDYVCIEVSDNGSGMDTKTRERIFDPFVTTKEGGKGTGLGLATAYGILQRHQGWIDCQSEPGVGTTFALYLPAATGPGVGEEASPVGTRALLPTGTETLMVVDDEDLVRRSTSRLFTELGYRVLEAENGLRCLDLFEQHRSGIDLVILDLSMPGVSGREVLRQLKAQQPRLKVVVFTGYAADPMEFAGLAQVIEKPFSLRQLAAVVRRTLDLG